MSTWPRRLVLPRRQVLDPDAVSTTAEGLATRTAGCHARVVLDDLAKPQLHDCLKRLREAVVAKTDGLSEYEVRRPMTTTGTNLLGLIKHMSTWEARYFGEVFGRPFPEALPPWDDEDADLAGMWATEHESRAEIIDGWRRLWEHSDATIDALPLDAPGHVPWWPRPEVTLFGVLVHEIAETSRHAGHADILREELDGAVGTNATKRPSEDDVAFWSGQRAKIERAARAAAGLSPAAGSRPPATSGP